MYLQTLLVYLLCSIPPCLVLRLLNNKYEKNLRSLPGPTWASFTDLWRFFDCLLGKPHETHIRLHRQYASPFIRLGPRTVSVSDPTLIPKIYGLNSGITKTDFYVPFMVPYNGQFTPSLFNARDNDYHAKYKKPIANAYSMSTLVEYEPLIDSTTAQFVQRLDEFAVSGKKMDLGAWLQMYAFDVIGEIVFSKKIGFLQHSSDIDGILGDIRAQVYLGGTLGQIPALAKFLLQNPIRLAFASTHPVVNFTIDRMRERTRRNDESDPSDHDSDTDHPKEARDFLTRCYDAQRKYPDLVTDRIIRMYNVDNILAGSDTTAISLRAIFYYLMKTPTSLRRVVAEIDGLQASSEYITWKESSSLPYLQSCIKEALRMHPAVALLLERYVPKGGMELGGRFFPEGTILGMNPCVTARNMEIYGADADVFRPDRWLEASPEALKEMERASLTFGAGARSCIGKNISILEIAKVVPQILRRYEFRFPDSESE